MEHGDSGCNLSKTMEKMKEKYLAGKTTPQEELQLRHSLLSKAVRTADEDSLLLLLQESTSRLQGDEAWLLEDESALFDRLMEQGVGQDAESSAVVTSHLQPLVHPPRHGHWPLWAVASLVAAVFCGVLYVNRVNLFSFLSGNTDNQTLVYIYGSKVVNDQVSMDMMEATMGEFFAPCGVEEVMGDFYE